MPKPRFVLGTPFGRAKIGMKVIPPQTITQDDQVECRDCGSVNLEDLAFSRQIGFFQDVCCSIVRCTDCGEITCFVWAEEKGGI